MNGRANDYVKEWLGAYLDGELSSERRAWVENHLSGCPDCRAELADLRALSNLLRADAVRADPASAAGMTDAEFTRQVMDRLPRPARPFWRRALRIGLRYAPLGLFGIWAFFQAVIVVTTALLPAMSLFPQSGGALAALGSLGSEGWLGSILSLAGSGSLDLETSLSAALSPLALLELALVVLLGMMFLAWLAALWSYRRMQEERI